MLGIEIASGIAKISTLLPHSLLRLRVRAARFAQRLKHVFGEL
jgi:hypothetical protein